MLYIYFYSGKRIKQKENQRKKKWPQMAPTKEIRVLRLLLHPLQVCFQRSAIIFRIHVK